MSRHPSRRAFARAGLALLGLSTLGADPPPVRRKFRVVETAGLRRFGFPVHAILDRVGDAKAFRLSRGGRPVPAQFRRVERDGRKDAVALDFNTSVGPLESEDYEVTFGTGIEAGPEPGDGLHLVRAGDRLAVGHRGGLTWVMPGDLSSLLNSVGDGRRDYLKTSPNLLSFKLADGSVHRIGEPSLGGRPGRLSVDREGPLAVGLRHSAQFVDSGKGLIASDARFTFVSSKSWIEVDWTLDDRASAVAEVRFELGLKLDGAPTLVDFGASSLVYGQIRGEESMRLVADPGAAGDRWRILQGKGGESGSVFARNSKEDLRPVEGWAHVSDKTRCTAIAVAGFGSQATDSIEVSAGGRVEFVRRFDGPTGKQGRGRKTLTFWVHVVPTPVQVGAATSPQAILGPPRVEWGDRVEESTPG